MQWRGRICAQPWFVAVTCIWLTVAVFVYRHRASNVPTRLRSTAAAAGSAQSRPSIVGRRTQAIADAGDQENRDCAECKIIKQAASHVAAADLLETEHKKISAAAWSKGTQADLPRLAIIVPYRGRSKNLEKFLKHMDTFLQKQARDTFSYWIFVVEQSTAGRFNRGKLCNAGFLLTQDYFDYFVFHDVDKLPEDPENSYAFPNLSSRWDHDVKKCAAFHLASRIQQFNYRDMSDHFIGGVIMFTREQFRRIGGMPNFYWGWGSEDDEVYDRIKKMSKGASEICRHSNGCYASLDHEHAGKTGDAKPALSAEDDKRYQCHYRIMLDYRENKRMTDKYTDAAFRVLTAVDDAERRMTTVAVDLCRGNFRSSCNSEAKDVGCGNN